MKGCLFLVFVYFTQISSSNVVKFQESRHDLDDEKTITKWNFLRSVYRPHRHIKATTLTTTPRLVGFNWKNCGDSTKEDFLLQSLQIAPDPLKIPGDIYVSLSAQMKTAVTSKLQASIELKMKVLGMWITVPCIDNVGSCTYSDLCELLSNITECPAELTKHNIPCHCPLRSGKYVLPQTKFTINIPIPLLSEDYKAVLHSTVQGKPFGCYEIDLKVK